MKDESKSYTTAIIEPPRHILLDEEEDEAYGIWVCSCDGYHQENGCTQRKVGPLKWGPLHSFQQEHNFWENSESKSRDRSPLCRV